MGEIKRDYKPTNGMGETNVGRAENDTKEEKTKSKMSVPHDQIHQSSK